MGDEDVRGCQFVHTGGVKEVVGDGNLGGVLLAGGGLCNNVVGCPFLVGGFPFCVQFVWGVEWFWRRGLLLAFGVWRHFAFDGSSRGPGLRGRHLGCCRCRGWKEGDGVVVQGEDTWLGGDSVVVLVCPSNDVASWGVVVWGLGLRLLDG